MVSLYRTGKLPTKTIAQVTDLSVSYRGHPRLQRGHGCGMCGVIRRIAHYRHALKPATTGSFRPQSTLKICHSLHRYKIIAKTK